MKVRKDWPLIPPWAEFAFTVAGLLVLIVLSELGYW
jgi:hypothetical protein